MGLRKYVKNNDSIRYSWFCILLQANVRKIQEEKARKTYSLLGDILYHGPRNDLPKEYAPVKLL